MKSNRDSKECVTLADLPCEVFIKISKHLAVEEMGALFVAVGPMVEGDFRNELGRLCKGRTNEKFDLMQFREEGAYMTVNELRGMLSVTRSERHVRQLVLNHRLCPELKGNDLIDIFGSSELEAFGLETFLPGRVDCFVPFIRDCPTILRVDLPDELKDKKEARVEGGVFDLLNELHDRRMNAFRGQKCCYKECSHGSEDSTWHAVTQDERMGMFDCHLCGVWYHESCSMQIRYYRPDAEHLFECDNCNLNYCWDCEGKEMRRCLGSMCRHVAGLRCYCSGCVNLGLVNDELVPKECPREDCEFRGHYNCNPICDACIRWEHLHDLQDICSECYRRRERLDGEEQENGSKSNPQPLSHQPSSGFCLLLPVVGHQ